MLKKNQIAKMTNMVVIESWIISQKGFSNILSLMLNVDQTGACKNINRAINNVELFNLASRY